MCKGCALQGVCKGCARGLRGGVKRCELARAGVYRGCTGGVLGGVQGFSNDLGCYGKKKRYGGVLLNVMVRS